MSRKRSPSKDRFRAGRRIAEKAAQNARSRQLVFVWFADYMPPAAKDPAPGTSARATQ